MSKNPQSSKTSGFKLTIKAKLVGLSVLMLLFLIGTSLFLRNYIVEGSQSREYQVELQALVEKTIVVSENFGDLKYWMTDLEVSWLNESEENADLAREQLSQNLIPLEQLYPDEVANIRTHTETFVSYSLEAVDAYVDENRVLGNSLASKARAEIVSVNLAMDSIFKDANDKALVSRTTATEQEQTALTASAAVVVFAVVVIALITFFITRSITKPLSQMTKAMTDLANGDFQVEIPAQGKQDEIGRMAKAVQVFKDNGIEQQHLEEEAKKADQNKALREREAREELEKQEQTQSATAQRDKQAKASEMRAQRVSEMIAAFESKVNAGIASLIKETGTMKKSVNSMVGTAQNASELSTTVATSAEQTTMNVQTVAAATEELSASIGEIDVQFKKANTISQEAVEEAKRSTEQVGNLARMARKISEIIDLINDIANQTNL
ncbi:MAG: HAMP domain-containing protein, partial [Sneathiella sp.]|nr:HAMP domain-containing protein [Sneathiella sp.]